MNMAPPVIPDGETLYRYAKPAAFPEGQTDIPIGIFQDANLSCDWENYQKSPENSFHIKEGKTVILAITVHDDIRNPKNPKRLGQLVQDWKQEIVHNPLTEEDDQIHGANPAHSLIIGPKKAPIAQAIANNSRLYSQVI